MTTYNYNNATGQLKNMQVTSNVVNVYQATYTYLPTTNLLFRAHVTLASGADAETTDHYYIYDGQHQLAYTYTMSPAFTYEFDDVDALGNCTGERVPGDFVTNSLNQYTQTPEDGTNIGYDGDGNLAFDSQWEYGYDAQGRLISVSPQDPTAPSAQAVEYTYDMQGRRTSRTVWCDYDTPTGKFTQTSEKSLYVYDGWDLVGEINAATGKLTRSYTWDPRCEGGVGGLLAITTYASDGSVAKVYRPCYDGQDNIMALIDLADGSVAARYEYSVFGQRTATGPALWACDFGQATKYLDPVTHTYNEGLRTRRAGDNHFMQRDPIGVSGGINEYEFNRGDPINNRDTLGMADSPRLEPLGPPAPWAQALREIQSLEMMHDIYTNFLVDGDPETFHKLYATDTAINMIKSAISNHLAPSLRVLDGMDPIQTELITTALRNAGLTGNIDARPMPSTGEMALEVLPFLGGGGIPAIAFKTLAYSGAWNFAHYAGGGISAGQAVENTATDVSMNVVLTGVGNVLGWAFGKTLSRIKGSPSVAPLGPPAPPSMVNQVGKYTTKIRWGILEINARPAGPGFWGERIPLSNVEANGYELQINPNGESYYLPHPKGGYVQFENLVNSTLQDGKLVIDARSFYRFNELPPFAQQRILGEATRQVEAASANGLQVQWLVSDEQAASQIRTLFHSNNINIRVTYLPRTSP